MDETRNGTDQTVSGAPQASDERPASPYVIDPAACVCCGTCVAACPVNAIAMTELCAVMRGPCIECGTCESVCPAQAIHKHS